MLPLVALVGRPNVGKSTLFNALTRSRDALVHDEPGVTRDRQYGLCRLEEGRPFAVCDTGGLTDESEGLAAATTKQSRAAAEEADLVLFIVDGREGLTAPDESILRWLRKTGRPIYLVVNKTDGIDAAACVNEFARTGIDVVIPIAASHQTPGDAAHVVFFHWAVEISDGPGTVAQYPSSFAARVQAAANIPMGIAHIDIKLVQLAARRWASFTHSVIVWPAANAIPSLVAPSSSSSWFSR